MKIEIAKTDLSDALNTVAPSLGSGNDLSAHVKFRVKPGTDEVEVLTYSGKIFGGAPLPCVLTISDGAPTSFTIEGKRLSQWCGAVAEGDLILEHEEGVTKASDSRGFQRFESLDPSVFPDWDTMIADSAGVFTIPAKRLCGILSHVKSFISTEETKTPQFCVTEVRKGIFHATDRTSATLVTVEEAEAKESNLRIFGKNINSLHSFLSTCGDVDVEVLEHDRISLFRTETGAFIGESRPTPEFPQMDLGKDAPDQHYWVLPKEEIENNMLWLRSGAPHEDVRLYFRPNDDQVEMGMKTAAGGDTFCPITCIERGSETDAPPVPDTGFAVNYKSLEKVFSTHKSKTIRFGINNAPSGTGGYVRFNESRNGDDYLSIILWVS